MFLQNVTSVSTMNYWDSIHAVSEAIKTADRFIIGVGSGMSAAGGLCYTDPALAEKWYPEYYAMGKKSIIEIMGGFWPTSIDKKTAAAYWGFWARHIYHIRYEPEALQPYRNLYSIINEKDHFICSTNVDGQLERAGFAKGKIFAPQGDYALLQCEKPCTQAVYDNKAMIDTMLQNMTSPFEIRQEDIPYCPRCGNFLMPNLRCDMNFVDEPHLENKQSYEKFLNDSQGKNIVLLELGVGFNTPVIIRYPFEKITKLFPRAMLVRINDRAASIPRDIEEKAISIQGDLLPVMQDLKTATQK